MFAPKQNFISDNASKKDSKIKNTRESKLTDLEIEVLILEVQKREPLWNFSLPLKLRNRSIVNQLWNEVSNELNGKLSAEDAKKKFKSLRDTHRKIIQSEQRLSGSANGNIKDKWKYYYIMEFLRDSCLLPAIESNMDSVDAQSEDSNQLMCQTDDDDSHIVTKRNNRKRRASSSFDDTAIPLNKIGNTFNKKEELIDTQSPHKLGEVDSILHAGALLLHRLPYKIRMQTAMEVLQLIHTKVQEHVQDDD